MDQTKISVRLKRVSLHTQTKLFAFGMLLPAALVWLGTYVMFTFPALLQQIETFLKNFEAAQTPWLYSNVLLPLNVNSGLDYYVIGVVLYLLALVIARRYAGRLGLSDLKLGDIRIRSLLMAALVSFMVIAVVVSLTNKALFDPLLALQTAA